MACKKYRVASTTNQSVVTISYLDCFGASQGNVSVPSPSEVCIENSILTVFEGVATLLGDCSVAPSDVTCVLTLVGATTIDTSNDRKVKIEFTDNRTGFYNVTVFDRDGSVPFVNSSVVPVIEGTKKYLIVSCPLTKVGDIRFYICNDICCQIFYYTLPALNVLTVCQEYKLTLPGVFTWKDCAGIDRSSATPTDANSGLASGPSGTVSICAIKDSVRTDSGGLLLIGDCNTGSSEPCTATIGTITHIDNGNETFKVSIPITNVGTSIRGFTVKVFKDGQERFSSYLLYQNGKVVFDIPKIIGGVRMTLYTTNACFTEVLYSFPTPVDPTVLTCDVKINNITETLVNGKRRIKIDVFSNIPNLGPVGTKVSQNNSVFWLDGGQPFTQSSVFVEVDSARTGVVLIEIETKGTKNCFASQYYTLANSVLIPEYVCDVEISKVEHIINATNRVIRATIISNIPNLAPFDYSIYQGTVLLGKTLNSNINGAEIVIDRYNSGTVRIECVTKGTKACVASFNYQLPTEDYAPGTTGLSAKEPLYNCVDGKIKGVCISDQPGDIEMAVNGITDWTTNFGPYTLPTDRRVGTNYLFLFRQAGVQVSTNYNTNCFNNYNFGAQTIEGNINLELWKPGALGVRTKVRAFTANERILITGLPNPLAWFSRINVTGVKRVSFSVERPDGSRSAWDELVTLVVDGTEEQRVVSLLFRDASELIQLGFYKFLIIAKDANNIVLKESRLSIELATSGVTGVVSPNTINLEAWNPGELGVRRLNRVIFNGASILKSDLPNPINFFSRINVAGTTKVSFRGTRPNATIFEWNENATPNPDGLEEQKVVSWLLRSGSEPLQVGQYTFVIKAFNISAVILKEETITFNVLETIPIVVPANGSILLEAWKTGELGVRQKATTLSNLEQIVKSALPNPINFFARVNVIGCGKIYFSCKRPNGTTSFWDELVTLVPTGTEEQQVVSLLFRNASEEVQLGKYEFIIRAKSATNVLLKETLLSFTVVASDLTPVPTTLSLNLNPVCSGSLWNVELLTSGVIGTKLYGVSEASNVAPTVWISSNLFNSQPANTTKTYWVKVGDQSASKSIALGDCGTSFQFITIDHSLPTDTYEITVTDSKACSDIGMVNI